MDVDSLLTNLATDITRWAQLFVIAALVTLVVWTMIAKFSFKAGIGAILLMVVGLGIWDAREELSQMFRTTIADTAEPRE